MAQVPARLTARARLALRALAEYEITHRLPRPDALALAARDARLSEWYVRYTLLPMPQGQEVYRREIARLSAAQEADDAA
jgi:hypothetical protein